MKKILLLGPEVTDFLNPLARKLIEIDYTVDLLETRKIPRNNPEISKSYSSVLNYNELADKRITAAEIIKFLFTIEFYKNLLKTVFLNYLEGNLRIIKSIRASLASQHSKEIFSLIFNKYDIINFHSLAPGTLSYIKSINPDKKVILSFWGSDLYQISGYRNYYEQYEAIKRADAITVMNYEMELMVLAKFGYEMKNKIVRLLFGIREEFFENTDEIKKNNTDMNFLRKYNIPENKIKITIGYCGNPICNHLLILDELEKIEQLAKEKFHLLVPMTYGNYTVEYMQEVILKLNKSNISYTVFDKFLSFEELLQLRVTSNIMIMMNKSDALSASVCEYLYAHNILISAIWLPYSWFRLEGLFFYESDFMQLSERVIYAVNNINEIKVKLAHNPSRIKKLFDSNRTLQQWTDLINSL